MLQNAYAGSRFPNDYAGSRFPDDCAGFRFQKRPHGVVGALGPIWGWSVGGPGTHLGDASGRPKADIMETEGQLNEGLGAKPPGILFVGVCSVQR